MAQRLPAKSTQSHPSHIPGPYGRQHDLADPGRCQHFRHCLPDTWQMRRGGIGRVESVEVPGRANPIRKCEDGIWRHWRLLDVSDEGLVTNHHSTRLFFICDCHPTRPGASCWPRILRRTTASDPHMQCMNTCATQPWQQRSCGLEGSIVSWQGQRK